MTQINIILTYLTTKVNTDVSRIFWLWDSYDPKIVIWLNEE